jgi:hypothetical protein
MRLLCYHYTRKALLATFVILHTCQDIKNFALVRSMHSPASLSRFYGHRYEVACPVRIP